MTKNSRLNHRAFAFSEDQMSAIFKWLFPSPPSSPPGSADDSRTSTIDRHAVADDAVDVHRSDERRVDGEFLDELKNKLLDGDAFESGFGQIFNNGTIVGGRLIRVFLVSDAKSSRPRFASVPALASETTSELNLATCARSELLKLFLSVISSAFVTLSGVEEYRILNEVIGISPKIEKKNLFE